ncbi:MAG: uroporphyrinogen decarboxylase family protein [Nitrososphaerales archaeon]
MNSRERVIKTMSFEEPDRVPMAELYVDVNLMEQILNVKSKALHSVQGAVVADREAERAYYELLYKTYEKLDFDIVYANMSLPDNYKPRQLKEDRYVDEIGRVHGYDKVTKIFTYMGTVFSNEDEVKRFLEEEFPDPYAEGRDFGLKELKKLNKERKALGVFIREPFAHVWEALTPIKFVHWIYSNPSIIKDFIDKMTEYNLGLIDVFGSIGFDIIVMGGDLCETKGPMLPPEHFRRLGIFEAMRKHVEKVHKYGAKLIKHTDGNVNPLLDDLTNLAKVDGVHSLDPSAGVEIGKVKEKYGDKLVLYGNVSVDNLALKGKEEIVEETKKVIRLASPGGGHILSSSNSWYGGVKLENCLAMVETAKKYGRYPISL